MGRPKGWRPTLWRRGSCDVAVVYPGGARVKMHRKTKSRARETRASVRSKRKIGSGQARGEDSNPNAIERNRAVASSESPEYLANIWLRREESILVFASKWFDADLKPLDRASDRVALEVRLIRDLAEGAWRARCEVRTSLSIAGATASRRQQLVNTIAGAQGELADRAGVSFAAPASARPHVFTAKSDLMRAYGKGSVLEVLPTARALLSAYWFLAHVWRAAFIGCSTVSLSRVRRIAEDGLAPENMDVAHLFGRPDVHQSKEDGSPELTDELVARVGVALGAVRGPNRRFARPGAPIVVGKEEPPRGVVRLVAEDLATSKKVHVDSVLRRILRPMLAGEFDGPIVQYTAAEASALRIAAKKRNPTRR